MEELLEQCLEPLYIDCPRCNRKAIQDSRDTHICVDCAKVENNRYMYLRQHQNDWMAVAKEAGIDLWLRQPAETQLEYTIWVAYRDSYPGGKPSYNQVAKQLNTTYNAVKKVAQRWSFQARMQAWMAECEKVTLLQRRDEILSMNKDHIDMSQRLRKKLSAAIDKISPEMLKPAEIASLMRVSSELERKALVDSIAQEEMRASEMSDIDNPNLKKAQTKRDDLDEIVKVLAQAGVIGEVTKIGIRTTEVAIIGSDPHQVVEYEQEDDHE